MFVEITVGDRPMLFRKEAIMYVEPEWGNESGVMIHQINGQSLRAPIPYAKIKAILCGGTSNESAAP
jgi:hypothetical protein